MVKTDTSMPTRYLAIRARSSDLPGRHCLPSRRFWNMERCEERLCMACGSSDHLSQNSIKDAI